MASFMGRKTGHYSSTQVQKEEVRAFLPDPLPPVDPPLVIEGAISDSLAIANAALSRLSVAAAMVPSAEWFLYGFVRKEAVITSRIEGTQATLRDVLEFEATQHTDRPEDVEEVCNYVDALAHARSQLADPNGLPLSTRLLCDVHRILMRGVRGQSKSPGEVRRSQNWIGGSRPGNARFVPPPPDSVPDALAALEQWLHAEDALPPLVRVGLAHVQFETIHPFLDGNGRIGRLLVSLLIEHWHLIEQPLLYLSLSIRRRQQEYYARLSAVREEGDWEGWTEFFLNCVSEAADDGVEVARELYFLIGRDRDRLIGHERATLVPIRLLDRLPVQPVITVPSASKLLGIAAPTARKAIELLESLEVLREITGKRRDRVYAYHDYMRILTGDES
jgi:Fic family protein